MLWKSYIKSWVYFEKEKSWDLKWKGNVHKLICEVLFTEYGEDQIVKGSLKAKDIKKY